MSNTYKRISGDVAERIDLEIRKANTMKFNFVFSKTDGTALDLTAFSEIDFAVLNSQSSSVITADLATGLSIDGAGSNILTLLKDESETNITAGKYTFKLNLDKANYNRQVLSGYFYINDGVTDPTTTRNIDGVTTVFIEGDYYTITVSNVQ